MAVATATPKVIWLQQLISELRINAVGPMPIYVNNRAAIKLIKDLKFYTHTKYINIKYYYV